MIERACAKCEEEKFMPPKQIKEYQWKNREYLLTDLFDVEYLRLPVENEYLGRDANVSKLLRAQKMDKREFENQYLMMGGFMSAKGHLGTTKYDEKLIDDPDWQSKTYYIANDLKDKKKKACEKQQKTLHMMEEK